MIHWLKTLLFPAAPIQRVVTTTCRASPFDRPIEQSGWLKTLSKRFVNKGVQRRQQTQCDGRHGVAIAAQACLPLLHMGRLDLACTVTSPASVHQGHAHAAMNDGRCGRCPLTTEVRWQARR
jgi:hypothetical protein